MSSEDSLNVRLAKWLGYRVVEEISTDQLDRGMDYYALFRPDGELVTWQDGAYEVAASWSPDEAWQHVPDFKHDLNAGMNAVPANDGHLYDWKIVQLLAGGFEAHLVRDTPPLGVAQKWQARGTTRAWAVANTLDAMRMAGVRP